MPRVSVLALSMLAITGAAWGADTEYNQYLNGLLKRITPLLALTKQQDDLAVQCYGTGGDNSRACAELDRVSKEHDQTARQIDSDGESKLFLSFHEQYLRTQMQQCSRIAAVGNAELASDCWSEAANAHDYLIVVAMGRTSPPTFVWSACSAAMSNSMSLGAKCVSSAKSIEPCSKVFEGDQTRYGECMTILRNGDWLYSRIAQGLYFGQPRY